MKRESLQRFTFISLALLLFVVSGKSQTRLSDPFTFGFSEPRSFFASERLDTTSRQEASDERAGLKRSKSPVLAIALSAALPGAGQIYTERYWKIPVIYGFAAWFGVNWKKADDLYQQYRSEYSASLEKSEFGGKGDERLRSIRDFYRNERDRFSLYLGLTYLLNIVDAYIGASLYGFDVSDDLSGASTIRFHLRVPIR